MVDYLTFEEDNGFRILFKAGATVSCIEIIHSVLGIALEHSGVNITVEIDNMEEVDWFFMQLIVSFARTLAAKERNLYLKAGNIDALQSFCAISGFEHLFREDSGCLVFSERY